MRKSRRNTLLKAAAGTLAAVCVITAGTVTLHGKMEGLRERIGELTAAVEAYTKETTVAICAGRDIMPGEELSPEDCVITEIAADSAPDDLLSNMGDLNGKILRVPVRANTYITGGMLVTGRPDNDERELKYAFLRAGTELSCGDSVDVRIRYPDSTDYIVLSKKTVFGADESGLTLHVNEEEILLMNSAIVDAYTYDGSEIYTVEYVQEALQTAAVVNYTPSISIMELIEKDPNILVTATGSLNEAVRLDIEGRLAVNEGN